MATSAWQLAKRGQLCSDFQISVTRFGSEAWLLACTACSWQERRCVARYVVGTSRRVSSDAHGHVQLSRGHPEWSTK